MVFTTISISDMTFDRIPSETVTGNLVPAATRLISVETNRHPTHQRHINRTADEVPLNKLKTRHPFTSLIAGSLSQN